MIANREQCTDGDKTFCEVNEFSRMRYAHGMLLDDKDFQSEQQYHVSKRKFLNRMLHGAGVVCGLAMKGNKDGQSIEVTPGLALDCAGNEIWVSQPVKVDLTSILPPRNARGESECAEPVTAKPDTYYIGIRYDEKATNPVAIYLPSGGCDERTCENSRYREGFCIEVTECCVEKPFKGLLSSQIELLNADSSGDNQNALAPSPAQPTRPEATCGHCTDNDLTGKKLDVCQELEKFCEQPVPCPHCCSCDKPCHVVLGKITVNEDLRLQTVCNNDCRRYVFTANLFQSLIVGLVGEDQEHITSSLLYNPVKAVCELLTELLKQYKQTDTRIPQDLNEITQAVRARVETAQSAQVAEVQKRLDVMEKSQVDFQKSADVAEVQKRLDVMEKSQVEFQKSVTDTHAELQKSLEDVAAASPPPPATKSKK